MQELSIADLPQSWRRPSNPKPIVVIGAGGIVNDAHLPAYRKAGFHVAGIYDVDPARSRATAERFGISKVFGSLEEAFAAENVVFDVAVPAEKTSAVLESIRDASVVLLQKPMGKDLEDARSILQRCRAKGLCAAVNFQLRFSPMMLALRAAIEGGLIGRVVDLEVRLAIKTPWEMFPALKNLERVEILVHSVHYLDWIRSILGDPKGVYARTVRHPDNPELKSSRTSAILDYTDDVRCCLSLNHNFPSQRRHQEAAITLVGTEGAAAIKLGLLLNYPEGEPDELEVLPAGGEWTAVPLQGRWFPDAFIGTMANLQRFAAGEDEELPTSVEDAYKTMALVEACYQSDASGAVPIPE